MATLHEYLDIDSSIKFIRDKLNTEFFLESNLFDLCVMEKIKPIIYYAGEIWITPIKEQIYYQDDFDEINDSNFLEFEFSQLTNFMGYLCINHIGRDETNFDNIAPRHLTNIKNMIKANPILNINKIGQFNKVYGTYFATIPKNGDSVFISNDIEIKYLKNLIETKDENQNNLERYVEVLDRINDIKYKPLEIKRNDLRFSINDLLDLIDKDFSILMKDIDKTKKCIIDLNAQLDQANARIAELEQQLQGNQSENPLFVLGAIMETAKQISKANYTQASHYQFILENYECTGLSQSNLEKTVSNAKNFFRKTANKKLK